jgi:hypothetical protein
MKRLTFLLLIVLLLCFNYAHSQDNEREKAVKEFEKAIETCKDWCKTYNGPEFCKRICEKEIFDLRWEFLDFDILGSALFYDPESVFTSDGIVKVWVKQIYSEKDKQDFIKGLSVKSIKRYKNLDYSLYLIKIDCSERKFQMLEAIGYASDGSVLGIENIPEFLAKWISIPPDSGIERLFEEVCETEE